MMSLPASQTLKWKHAFDTIFSQDEIESLDLSLQKVSQHARVISESNQNISSVIQMLADQYDFQNVQKDYK